MQIYKKDSNKQEFHLFFLKKVPKDLDCSEKIGVIIW